MAVVLRAFIAAFFALGDDVVFEGYAILVALHDDQLAPSPGEMNSQRELVSPGADAMNDAVLGEEFDQVVHRGEDGAVEEFGVILVVVAEPLDRVALGGQLFRRDLTERRYARQPPFHEGLVHHLWNDTRKFR